MFSLKLFDLSLEQKGCKRVSFPQKQRQRNKALAPLLRRNTKWFGVLWSGLKGCNGPDSYLSNPRPITGLLHSAASGSWLWWEDPGSQSKTEKNILGILSALDQRLSCTIDVHLYFTSQNLMLPKIGKEIFQILIRLNPALM